MSTDRRMRNTAFICGNIITMDCKKPRAEAILVVGDRISVVGSNSEIEAFIDGGTEVIDLGGRTLVPGFIDCHAHPMFYGESLMAVDCRTPPVSSIKELVSAIHMKAEEEPKGEWIIGTGYDDFKLAERRHPNRWDLDDAAPDNPVVIMRLCGHVSVMNSLALQMAGITKDSADPEGGHIDKDQETGEPTGVLRGNAMTPIYVLIPPSDMEKLRRAFRLAAEQFLARGVTSVSDADVDSSLVVKAYQAATREDGVPLRVNLMMSVSMLDDLSRLGVQTGFGDDKLRIGAIKIVADGSSSGRTAAVSEPYEDDPGNTGIMYISREELDEKILASHKAGFQVGVHAIGDKAISVVLDSYEKALKELPRADHRLRIEHCGICTPTIIERIKRICVIPVPQPIFLYGEGESYRAGLGEERVKWAYPLRSYLENGIVTPMSSDCPATSGTELISPLLGIYVAVTRKTDSGRELGPEQRILVEDALRCYTLNSAYAAFEDDVKGSIEPGKLADFAVLSEDPTRIAEEKIKDTYVEMTIVGGKVVYTRP